MTDNEIRITISVAEACGWHELQWLSRKGKPSQLLGYTPESRNIKRSAKLKERVPDYLNDLNAIQVAVNALTTDQRLGFVVFLSVVTLRRSDEWFPARVVTAPAREWCEAYLRTIGKWKEEKR